MHARTFLSLLVLAAVALAGPLATPAQPTEAEAAWRQLAQPTFDPEKVATVDNVVLKRDLGTLRLESGTLGFARPVNGRVLQAAFRGQGRLTFAPGLPFEIQQLKFHTGTAELSVTFTEAVFLFSDSTLEEVADQVAFGRGEAASLAELYTDRQERLTYYGANWLPRLLYAALSENPDPYAFFHAELKTDKYGWMTFDFDRAEMEEVQVARWDRSRSWLVILSRFPAEGRDPRAVFQEPLAKDAYRIDSYDLFLTVEKNTDVRATAEIHLTALLPGQRVLLLDLDPNLRVRSVKDSAGRALAHFQPEDPKDRNLYVNYLAVVLPETTREGRKLALTVEYAGERVVRHEGKGVYFAQSFGWYPAYSLGKPTLHNPEFIRRFHFDMALQVPKEFDAVAVGKKVNEAVEGDYKITRWTTVVPVAVAGFSFGSYYIHEQPLDQDTDVQVYVNKHADEYMEQIELLAEQVSVAGVGGGSPLGPPGIPDPGPGPAPGGFGTRPGQRSIDASDVAGLEMLSPSQLGKPMLEETTNSLQLFEKYFGEYPYPKLAVTNIPYGYGQGWPGLLYVSSLTFLDSYQRHQLFRLTGGRISPRQQTEITSRFRAHETSHQWWGHVVGWKSYRDQWLSEGFAEFSGMLYTLFKEGRDAYLEALEADREPLLNADRYGAKPDEIGPIYLGQRLSSPEHPGTYSTVVYNKGGWVLHMLRMMMFDPRQPEADGRFINMMKEFTRTYQNQAASTEDFKRIAEKYITPQMDIRGNGSLDWFFNQWVYNTGIPHYEVSYSIEKVRTNEGQTGWKLKGTIRQTNGPEDFIMMVPVYVHRGKDNTWGLGWVVVRGSQPANFDATLPFEIDRASIDYWEDVLCTVDYKKK